jgi:hypothetical protein
VSFTVILYRTFIETWLGWRHSLPQSRDAIQWKLTVTGKCLCETNTCQTSVALLQFSSCLSIDILWNGLQSLLSFWLVFSPVMTGLVVSWNRPQISPTCVLYLWWSSRDGSQLCTVTGSGTNRFLGWVTACLASGPAKFHTSQTVHIKKSESTGHVQCVIMQVVTRILQLRHLTVASYMDLRYSLHVLKVYSTCVLWQ